MNNTGKIVAIIQARMGSSRLPGKTMMELCGKPMLWHLINRLDHAKLISDIVIATTTDKRDDIIEKFCEENGILLFRGSEEDVLDRYYQAAKRYNADTIVRITSDCPLIDPRVVDKVIKEYLKNRKFVSGLNNVSNRTYPRGLDTEVFSFSALETAWKHAVDPYQREHPTVYIYEHPELFKVKCVENSRDLSMLRWTVDEKKDFMLVTEIYKRLYKAGGIFLMSDIVALMEKEPFLMDINKDVKQKPVNSN